MEQKQPQLTPDKNKIKIGIQNSKTTGPDKNNCEDLSISGAAGMMLFIQVCVFVCEYVHVSVWKPHKLSL